MARIKVQGKVTPISQNTVILCWLACCEMLYQWRGKQTSEVVTKLKAAQIDTTIGLPPEKQVDAATALGLLPLVYPFVSTVGGLKVWLELYGPLKVSVKWTGVQAIVVTGVDTNTDEFCFIDPYGFDPNGWSTPVKENWALFNILKQGMKNRGMLAGGVQVWGPPKQP